MEASHGGLIAGLRLSMDDAMASASSISEDRALKENTSSADLMVDIADSASHESGAHEDVRLDAETDETGNAKELAGTAERRFRIASPLSFASMMALEQAARALPGISSAAVAPATDGEVVLTLVGSNPTDSARRLSETYRLPAPMEAL